MRSLGLGPLITKVAVEANSVGLGLPAELQCHVIMAMEYTSVFGCYKSGGSQSAYE